MKVGQNGPTFWVPGKTVIFFGVKTVVPSSTPKMRKSHKKLARVYAYTHAYIQIGDGGGKSVMVVIWFWLWIEYLWNSSLFTASAGNVTPSEDSSDPIWLEPDFWLLSTLCTATNWTMDIFHEDKVKQCKNWWCCPVLWVFLGPQGPLVPPRPVAGWLDPR